MTLAEELEAILTPDSERRFGQLLLKRSSDGVFTALNGNDSAHTGDLEPLDSVPELRELARFDAENEYRPLKTAPTLKSGWFTTSTNAADFLRKLDAIYPGAFAIWIAYRQGEHHPTSLRDTLNRQTGMYRFAGSITDQMANRIMRDLCAAGCLRKIAWPIDNACPVGRIKAPRNTIPLVCTEACTLAVGEARRLVKEAYDKNNAPASTGGN